ncbi:MAG: DUF1828 domain-containing protein [Clostridia bacterium]|nr:DUF1828 domain-containing protein [Clostridia bacterium]
MTELADILNHSFVLEVLKEGIVLKTPIMYQAADHTFSFLISRNASGNLTVTDRGQTIDYLRENLDVNKYADFIRTVCQRFEIKYEQGAFYAHVASVESGQTARTVCTFIGAMNMIANADLFCGEK